MSQEIHQIGYFKPAVILSRRGNRLAPEKIARPNVFGETSKDQFRGFPESRGWNYQELFPHVKSQGYTNPQMI
jgi:hypothetical protein